MTTLLTGTAAAHAVPDPAYVTQSITVSGQVEQGLTLTVQDLRQFPARQVTDVPSAGKGGADMGKSRHFKGVLLRDILDQAKLAAPTHNDAKKLYIVATASDGYQAVFSWGEIFNAPLGDGVLVLYEQDGKPLDDGEGKIAMISSKDTRTGPRHVKWLKSISVRKVAD
ncbi:molybdopterin-dependent oxidoreductase [Janthinobacterium agaricidamnosum]|uniref:molybdopterin-dependent oxidoreductase n=1 Tax=Janthinobacterium agaricidamnosum TaxID=55508 RepID=UPI001F59068C|nr:molybdopterin-dependent oxidoreductase [Janthinobacterium agaricidamnosum]